jgi:hypothetical protein
MDVTINAVEMYIASQVGTMRYIASRQKNFQDRGIANDWDGDCNGAIGELAVAKSLRIYWNPTLNSGKKPDVSGYQVRATTRKNGCLIIRPNDKLEEVYILATFKFPIVRLCGWMWLSEAKIQKFHRPEDNMGPEAYWVHQNDLMHTPLPKVTNYVREQTFVAAELSL